MSAPVQIDTFKTITF